MLSVLNDDFNLRLALLDIGYEKKIFQKVKIHIGNYPGHFICKIYLDYLILLDCAPPPPRSEVCGKLVTFYNFYKFLVSSLMNALLPSNIIYQALITLNIGLYRLKYPNLIKIS